MDKYSLIEKYVACPFCKQNLKAGNTQLVCKGCKKTFALIDNEIPSMLGKMNNDSRFSMAKWDKLYRSVKESEEDYKRLILERNLKQVLEYSLKNDSKIYLEIGCGSAFLGQELARQGWLFIGIDFSLEVLKSLKKRLDKYSIKNYLLIHGDIQSLPLRDNSVNLIYGGGVIEHFKNPQPVLNNIFNSLAKGGVSFNAVPFFNIGNLVYRSFWGGIPNVIVLKQLAEFIHLKLLRGRHMVFGYELQFTAKQLKKMHINAGFNPNDIILGRFDCYTQLNMITNPILKKFFGNLCRNNSQFWPMLKVIGIKK